MGIFSSFGRGSSALDNVAEFSARGGVASPWTAGTLSKLVYDDVFGTDLLDVNRKEAMSLPPVVNGRARIISEIANRPLRAVRGGVVMSKQPAWLYRTDSDVSPWHRMAGTLDDFIFYGESLWTVTRGVDNQILDALRVPYSRWRVADGSIEVLVDPAIAKWTFARPDEVLYFPGPFEGLLSVAGRTIRAAANLEASWANRAATPLPGMIITPKEDGERDEDEVTELVAAAAKARRSPNGPVMFVPWAYDTQIVGENDPAMLSEARNAYKLDIANFLALDAQALDAALPKASLNYETQAGKQDGIDSRMPYWTAPLEARLSMDDVCPRGQRVLFDFSTNPTEAGGDTGPYQED